MVLRRQSLPWMCLPVWLALAGAVQAQTPPAPAAPDGAVERGRYVFQAAGCLGCHTDEKGGGAPLAGGRALVTPFGTFHTPNITPDPTHGIGRWSEEAFIRAFRQGEGADGKSLFPAFPYPSYTRIRDDDLRDLRAYLMAQPPVATPNRPHDLTPPFGWRFLLPVWQALYLEPGPLADDPARPPDWNRGRYLVEALGHCGECHTPRDWLGGPDTGRAYAGTAAGPDGDKVPNITPAKKGIGGWSESDIALFLEMGMLPDGDFAGGAMAEVIRNSTSRLTADDRRAIVVYLKSLPPMD